MVGDPTFDQTAGTVLGHQDHPLRFDTGECAGREICQNDDRFPDNFGPATRSKFAVVIVNSLDTALVRLGVLPHLEAGELLGYPAVTNLKVSEDLPGTKDRIPGVRAHPTKPGVTLTAVGAYVFGSALAGNSATLQFSFRADGKSGPCLGVTHRFYSMWNVPISAVCADMKPYGDDAKTFQDSVFANGQSTATDAGSEVAVSAAFEPGGNRGNECLVVWVRKPAHP